MAHLESAQDTGASAPAANGDESRRLAETWSPLSPGYLADPYSEWDLLAIAPPTFNRTINAVVPGATGSDQPCLLVSRHADVLEVLRQPRVFETPESVNPRLPPVPERFRHRLPNGWPWEGSMLFGTEQWTWPAARKATAQALTGAAVNARLPRIRETATSMLGALAPQGHCDLIHDFCHPFVVRMLAVDVVGLDEEALDLADAFCRESQLLFLGALGLATLSDEQMDEIAEHQALFREHVLEVIAARKAQPSDDLISELLRYRDGGLQDIAILKVAYHVLLALDQPVLMIGNIVHHLLSEPERWQEIVEDGDRIEPVVDECMRLLNTLPILQTRMAMQDTQVGGVDVPRGTLIALHAGAANRDPARFDKASSYCPARPDADETLTFSRWSHFCIGSKLARNETVIVIEAIRATFSRLRLVDPSPPRAPGLFNGFAALPVAWDAAAG